MRPTNGTSSRMPKPAPVRRLVRSALRERIPRVALVHERQQLDRPRHRKEQLAGERGVEPTTNEARIALGHHLKIAISAQIEEPVATQPEALVVGNVARAAETAQVADRGPGVEGELERQRLVQVVLTQKALVVQVAPQEPTVDGVAQVGTATTGGKERTVGAVADEAQRDAAGDLRPVGLVEPLEAHPTGAQLALEVVEGAHVERIEVA